MRVSCWRRPDVLVGVLVVSVCSMVRLRIEVSMAHRVNPARHGRAVHLSCRALAAGVTASAPCRTGRHRGASTAHPHAALQSQADLRAEIARRTRQRSTARRAGSPGRTKTRSAAWHGGCIVKGVVLCKQEGIMAHQIPRPEEGPHVPEVPPADPSRKSEEQLPPRHDDDLGKPPRQPGQEDLRRQSSWSMQQ
ncbi:hypothetical protein [Cupriavidus taiwanensis]|nr:hypothetical protein [Cupriavidus taiwanensis]